MNYKRITRNKDEITYRDPMYIRLQELEDKIENNEIVDVKENHLIQISRVSGKSSLKTVEILTKYENGLLKEIPEDSVVLTREELSKRDYEFRQIGYDECLRDNPKKDKYIKTLERKIDQLNAKLDQVRKETAEKILTKGHEYLMNSTDKAVAFACFLGIIEHDYGVEIKE